MHRSKKPKTINPDEVDPSIYYYDEVYDDMKSEEAAKLESDCDKSRSSRDTPGGSKYIQGLIETAEQRKSEKELRKFKRYARDREEAAADGKLQDTEVFVTSAYKKKLEEMKKLDQEKRRRDEREQSRSMNFTKLAATQHLSNDETKMDDNKQDVSIQTRGHESQNADDGSVPEEIPVKQPDSEEKVVVSPRKRPKTIEERRLYLREVLAKRTVGDVFKAALERYRARKAQSSA